MLKTGFTGIHRGKKTYQATIVFITSEPREEYQMDLMFFADMRDRVYEGVH